MVFEIMVLFNSSVNLIPTGTEKPCYTTCVSIVTKAALSEMVLDLRMVLFLANDLFQCTAKASCACTISSCDHWLTFPCHWKF